jgi:hypothetical protein
VLPDHDVQERCLVFVEAGETLLFQNVVEFDRQLHVHVPELDALLEGRTLVLDDLRLKVDLLIDELCRDRDRERHDNLGRNVDGCARALVLARHGSLPELKPGRV